MQKAVGLYVVRRALHNARSRHPDAYVPFENSWSKWAPQPLAVNEALRACIHLRNRLQDVSRDLANKYLQSLNIFPHPCMQCHVNFDTSLEMICHFVGVVHVRRLYTYNPHALSLIDVECVEKIISEVSALEETRNVHLTPFEHHHVPSFFDDADVNAAFESLKSTIHVMQSVPLLHAPRDRSDVCEPIGPFSEFSLMDLFTKTEKKIGGKIGECSD
uniref:Uncharacterized protein n=1 Tax=Caenorhabditis japonica TaxID=281687 RepID=A0A8R1EPL0_CAEJA